TISSSRSSWQVIMCGHLLSLESRVSRKCADTAEKHGTALISRIASLATSSISKTGTYRSNAQSSCAHARNCSGHRAALTDWRVTRAFSSESDVRTRPCWHNKRALRGLQESLLSKYTYAKSESVPSREYDSGLA